MVIIGDEEEGLGVTAGVPVRHGLVEGGRPSRSNLKYQPYRVLYM